MRAEQREHNAMRAIEAEAEWEEMIHSKVELIWNNDDVIADALVELTDVGVDEDLLNKVARALAEIQMNIELANRIDRYINSTYQQGV